jgi:hypothetical protein
MDGTMSKAKTNKMIKRIVDAAITVLLLCLMAYQVTGEMAHEWIGMGMTVLVVIHQILNRKWYSALFKGKYNPYRSITTILNTLLLVSFALTAFCGMACILTWKNGCDSMRLRQNAFVKSIRKTVLI